ncbi:MAG TPA: uL13 family ribosomal protein [Cyclobacteriaceae bacterium]|jgi:large subunit ribosomal protein L13|nr:uL13 family ribosomal protein [Cyclobacteriaceae bacterium]
MSTTHTIDAKGKTLGRVASAAAKLLMGKTTPDYTANKVADVRVTIINAKETKMTEARMSNTLHERYSGFPGGFKTATNAEIITKKGWGALYELAVYGMLPSNKLRPLMMKHLTITE